jgi:DNA invertase Pin-like site-specific DNA recombinase
MDHLRPTAYLHSYTEPHLATDNELVRNVLLALLSSLAKVEAQKISERTKAGTTRTDAKGVKVGRPKLGVEVRQQIARRAPKSETPYSIAKALRIDRHTVCEVRELSRLAMSFVSERLGNRALR